MPRDPDGLDALDFPREHDDELGAITTAQAREIDRWASAELCMPVLLLMENAGRAVAQAARGVAGRGVVWVLAGPGNNGGDGLAAARFLAPRVRVVLFSEPDPTRCPEAAVQLRILRNTGSEIHAEPGALPGKPAVVIDALLGTGLGRPVEGRLADWIHWLCASGAPVVAVDVPSGLHSDTGATLGCAAKAAMTVTFARAKLGLTTPAGRERSGRILVASLGIPEPALARFLARHRTRPDQA